MRPPDAIDSARHRSAFSLTEVLVVAAVVGILAGLALPLLSRTRQSANEVKATHNLRQLGALIQGYVADNQFYPPATDGVTWRGSWADAISPYAGHDSWWGSDPVPVIDSPAKKVRTRNTDRAFIANPAVMQDVRYGGGQLISPARVRRLSEVILLADGVQNPSTGRVADHMWQMPGVYDTNPANADRLIPATENLDNGTAKIRFRNSGNTALALFADGHVDRKKNGEIKYRNFSIAY